MVSLGEDYIQSLSYYSRVNDFDLTNFDFLGTSISGEKAIGLAFRGDFVSESDFVLGSRCALSTS